MVDHIRAQLAAQGIAPPKGQKVAQVQRKPPAPTKDTKAPVAAAEAQEIAFNEVVPGNNGAGGLLRSHWTRKRRLLASYEWVVGAARLAPMLGPVRLELVRYSIGPSMDYDNLVSTGKLLVDAIVRCGILPDDKPAVIAERDYRQVRTNDKASQRTVIRLIPL